MEEYIFFKKSVCAFMCSNFSVYKPEGQSTDNHLIKLIDENLDSHQNSDQNAVSVSSHILEKWIDVLIFIIQKILQ